MLNHGLHVQLFVFVVQLQLQLHTDATKGILVEPGCF
jgi:hypothetical protein